jgi:DnaJ-class molecular chaperone
MLKKDNKKTVRKLVVCKDCKGNGYVRGKIQTGTCLFCNGSGHKNHDQRMTDVSFLDIVKLCEFYVQKNDKQNYN